MEIFNGISDLVLAITCLYVFFRFIDHLNFSTTILWESFILSVGVAAFFGALGFFGFQKAIPVSMFFQKLAIINGAVGLVCASAALVSGTDFSRWASYGFIALGFVLFAMYEVFEIKSIYFWIPIVSMAIVIILGFFALINGKTHIGIWLIVGVAFFAMGSFRKEIFGDTNFSISLYHLLMAGGILSIGMANSKVVNIRK